MALTHEGDVTRAALAIAAAVLLASLPPARAAECVPDALLLARVCVSEAGWACWETGDGLVIHESFLAGAERQGTTYAAYARSYSPRATGAVPATTPRLAWVQALDEALLRPVGWPSHLPWAPEDRPRSRRRTYRARWLEVLDGARERVALELADREEWSVCAGLVTDWAARGHEPSPGLTPVDCGPTRNATYARRPR